MPIDFFFNRSGFVRETDGKILRHRSALQTHFALLARPTGIFFRCSSPCHRPHLGCGGWAVAQDKILPDIKDALIKAVDFEIIRRMETKLVDEKKRQLEIAKLKKHVGELKGKIERGSKNLLVASPDLFPAMQAGLLELKAELLKAENTLELATIDASKDGRGLWAKWYDDVKRTLQPFVRTGTIPRRMKGTPEEIHRVYNPVAMLEPDAVRELLHRLKCRVTLRWVPCGKRRFEIERADIKAEFGSYPLCPCTNTPAGSATRNSKSSFAR